MPAASPRLGADPVVNANKAGIDMTLLRENLRLSVEWRFRRLMELLWEERDRSEREGR
jgi:hypothetical protein